MMWLTVVPRHVCVCAAIAFLAYALLHLPYSLDAERNDFNGKDKGRKEIKKR